jgi:cyclic pyranopterin phosphate synthase
MPRRAAALLTHLDARSQPTMVNIGGKAITHRTAEAIARVRLPSAVARALQRTGHRSKKGPVFDTAILAGVMAAKRTSELIPFCHPLPLEQCQIDISYLSRTARGAVLEIRCRVELHHKTGVEMEALTGATVAALTVYDMCKALSHDIRIEGIKLVSKTGGKRTVGRRAP